jgi:hypothetical protein
VAEQSSSEECHIAILSGSYLILKAMMTLESSVPLDSVYKIEQRFEQVYKFEIVYRDVTKLSLLDCMSTLVTVRMSLSFLASILSDL